jgi:hypothetical protein
MKTKYVRIYSEEELRSKVQRISSMLKSMKQKIADDVRFGDIAALTEMWVQYEMTRFVVTESFLEEDEGYKYDPYSLYIEREVEDDYSDELKDPDSLHNELVSLQLVFDNIQWLLSNLRDIDRSQYMQKYNLVLDLATDIYRHLDHSNPSEHEKFLCLLDDLNYRYLNDTECDDVLKEEVIINEIARQCKEADTLDKLITTLDLVAD